MDFYLIPPDGEEFHFPVNPENIVFPTETQIDTIDINDLGEIDIPIGERRPTIRFSSFFPKHYDSYCQYREVPDPDEAYKMLDNIRKEKKPVRLLISDSPINDTVLIIRLTPEIRGGEPGDIYFTIEFRSYRETKVKKTTRKVTTTSSTAKKRTRTDSKPKVKTYIVKKGDNLWNIAKAHLGAGSKWPSIYNMPENKKVIGSIPNLIYPGQKLVMPS